jgi:isoaspartyl peptidase/L-asparaginase-like protein (Ntn-hydrolase superfamily)
MLVGEGADDFARAMGVPQASVEELTTLEARMELEYFKKFRRAVDESFKQG